MRYPFLFALFFTIAPLICVGQFTKTWGIKVGLNGTNQVYENLPRIAVTNINNRIDTLFFHYGGGYNRASISAMVYREFAASRSVSLLVGIGYRQRGFAGDARYNPQSGWVEELPDGQYNKNVFHQAYADLEVKIRRYRNGRLAPYVLLGNRVDCRLNFYSEFWGNDYQYLTRMELSPVAGAGVEIPLRGVYLIDKIIRKEALGDRVSRFTVEVEVNPSIMNAHAGELINNNVYVGGPASRPLIATPRKIVSNNSFGFSVGVML